MALTLEHADFDSPVEGGRAGLLAWWVKDEERKQPFLCIRWADLLVIRPRVSWPRDLDRKAIDGWGRDSQHLAYVPSMGMWTIQTIVPVPALGDLMSLRRRKYQRAKLGRRVFRWSKRLRFRELDLCNPGLGCSLWIPKRSLRRLEAALEGAVGPLKGDLDARIVQPPWDEGTDLLVVWKGGDVRASASIVPTGVLERSMADR